jgi:hypothetical protein
MKSSAHIFIAFLCLFAVGCGGVAEVPAQTEPGPNASEAEMKKRMEESMKMSGRQMPPAPAK